MRWFLGVLLLVSIWAWMRPAPSRTPPQNATETFTPTRNESDYSIVGGFLHSRGYSPKEWTLCIDRLKWERAPELAGLSPEAPQMLWIDPFRSNESHGMALLLGSTSEQRKQYPDWPRNWFQCSPVGYDATKTTAGFTYVEVMCPNDKPTSRQGWAKFRRLADGNWTLDQH